MNRFLLLFLSFFLSFRISFCDEIEDLIRYRLEKSGGTAIAVGIIDADNLRMECYGRLSLENRTPIDENTLFEIGSITKLFTALLLQEKVHLGYVRYIEPAYRYLPRGWKIPYKSSSRAITFEHLVTHYSGLPYMPTNSPIPSVENPFANYTEDQFREFIFHYELPRKAGEAYEYSNVGMALLGHILGGMESTTYGELVERRICQPLGMKDTTLQLDSDQLKRFAIGHVAKKRVENWDMPVLAGAGALRSTLKDMVTFLRINMGQISSTLYPYMIETHRKCTSTDYEYDDIGYGWYIRHQFSPEIIWHNGGTAGYRSFIGFCPLLQKGIVILSNSATKIDDLGFHLLDSRYPLEPQSIEVSIDPSILTQYEGIYKHRLGLVCHIYQCRGHLFLNIKGYPEVEAFPLSDRKFYIKEVPIQIEFDLDDNENIKMIAQYGDQKYFFKKIS